MDIRTKIIRITPEAVESEKIEEIAGILRADGVMAYPTETFYGLGGNGFSTRALQKIYALKARDPAKPLSVVISDPEMALDLALSIPSLFWDLAGRFWPGPLTVVLKASPRVPRELLGSGESIGLRVPPSPWLRALVREAAFPVTATSANPSGGKEISSPEEVVRIFETKVDLIVDGGRTPGVKPSTVLDLTTEKPRILRSGAVPDEQLRDFLS